MITVVTDRTQANVDRLKELKQKALTGHGTSFANRLTAEEIAEYNILSNKGAYNASDLNRVGTACATLYALLQTYGYDVPSYYQTRTDWSQDDIPTERDMGWYIQNVHAIKAVFDAEQDVPDSMEYLDVYGANAIEQLLAEVETLIQLASESFVYPGEGYSGEF